MDKNGKKPAGTIRQFFRRISLLGILLAGGILIYSANREDLGSWENGAETEQEKSTIVQGPKKTRMEATPQGMRVHQVAYSYSEEDEALSSTAMENPAEYMGENPAEDIGEQPDMSSGVQEMPGMYDSVTDGNDSAETMLPTLPEQSGASDWETDAARELEASEYAQEAMLESDPVAATASTAEKETVSSLESSTSASAYATVPPASSSTGPITPASPPHLPPLIKDGSHPLKNVTGPPVQNFLEVFDFNIDPDWVVSRWSYVTSVGPLNTRGYRVPLCTGIDKSDLVGNLTYYFNHKLEVEKITFEGYTGDLERLLLTLRYFHMAKRVTSDPNVILYESPTLSNHYQSYMRSYHRTTPLDGETPHHRFWITMELYPEEDE